MSYSNRVIQILAAGNYLRDDGERIDPESLTAAIINNLPRATREQARADRDGTYTAIVSEMLPKVFNITVADEDLTDIFALGDIYSTYTSTKADGRVQSAINGDGRSFLADIPTTRNGQKFGTSRYITNDPVAVRRLGTGRIQRAVSSVRTAVQMRALIVQRQPELAGDVNADFAMGLQEMTMLMAPINTPTPALPPKPADPQPTTDPQPTPEPPATDEPTQEPQN